MDVTAIGHQGPRTGKGFSPAFPAHGQFPAAAPVPQTAFTWLCVSTHRGGLRGRKRQSIKAVSAVRANSDRVRYVFWYRGGNAGNSCRASCVQAEPRLIWLRMIDIKPRGQPALMAAFAVGSLSRLDTARQRRPSRVWVRGRVVAGLIFQVFHGPY